MICSSEGPDGRQTAAGIDNKPDSVKNYDCNNRQLAGFLSFYKPESQESKPRHPGPWKGKGESLKYSVEGVVKMKVSLQEMHACIHAFLHLAK